MTSEEEIEEGLQLRSSTPEKSDDMQLPSRIHNACFISRPTSAGEIELVRFHFCDMHIQFLRLTATLLSLVS